MTRAKRIPITIATALVAVLALSAPASAQPEDGGAGDGDAPGDGTGDGAKDDGTSDADPVDTGKAAPPADEVDVDVEALRQQYLKLRDRLFRSRARAAAVASSLYSTKLTVKLKYTTGRFYSVTRTTIRLDGSNIYDDTEGNISNNNAPRFEGWVAPGRHVVSIRVEADGKDDQRFRSAIEDTFTVQAPPGHDLIISATAKDGGDIPYNWRKNKRGSYKLHVDVNIEAVKRREAKRDKKKVSKRK